jgi:hypothetical protein
MEDGGLKTEYRGQGMEDIEGKRKNPVAVSCGIFFAGVL